MPEYSLSLRLDTESLVTARRLGQKIVVAKAPAEASAQVVWVAFDPMRTNEVTWASGYTLCARRGLSDVVETLTPESPTPSGAAYKLDGSGFQRTDEKLFPPQGTYRPRTSSSASSRRFPGTERSAKNGSLRRSSRFTSSRTSRPSRQ